MYSVHTHTRVCVCMCIHDISKADVKKSWAMGPWRCVDAVSWRPRERALWKVPLIPCDPPSSVSRLQPWEDEIQQTILQRGFFWLTLRTWTNQDYFITEIRYFMLKDSLSNLLPTSLIIDYWFGRLLLYCWVDSMYLRVQAMSSNKTFRGGS